MLRPYPRSVVSHPWSRRLGAFLASLLLGLSPASAQSASVAEADVLIYGANAAGVAAAVQVARMGRSVILLEPGTHVGGLTTGGLGATDTGAKESVGGIAKEFYRRIHDHYRDPASWVHETRAEYAPRHPLAISERLRLHWFFEPKVASLHLSKLMEEAGVSVIRSSPLDRGPGGVEKDGTRITAIRTTDGRRFAAMVFIDTTYEGDLMAAAGASYIVGRESNATYGETLNGIVFLAPNRAAHVSPYVVEGDPSSGLLPRILPEAPGVPGEGDGRTQAYNFRVCLTDVPENRVAFVKPERYDPLEYELVLRHMKGRPGMLPGNRNNSGLFTLTPMPNRKTDSNNRNLFSTDYIGKSWDWPEASYEEREKIRQEHEDYIRGLFWFLANDPRVPADVQREVNRWGLAADEFTDNANWPPQLYVREARRMIGEYVVTEHDARRAKVAEDPVALASYAMDSHSVSLFVDENRVLRLEGSFFASVRPYPVSYRAILPRRAEVANLLVPVCLSSSHVAYGSIRMEPVFMMLAQSAATAAVLAMERGEALHDLPYGVLRERLVADGQVLAVSQPVEAPAAPAQAASRPAAAAPAAAPAAVSPEDRELATLLVRLERAGIITEKAYWFSNARSGKTCDGEKVGQAIIAAASRIKPVESLDAALELLVARRVITKADTWSRLARPGNGCSGAQVRSLLSRLATTVEEGARPPDAAPVRPAPQAQAAPAAAPVAEDRELAGILVKLERAGIITEKVYWYTNARRGETCDGAKVGEVIIAAASRFKPVTDVDAALEVLVARRVITKADTWSRLARPGNGCSGAQVRSLLSRLAATAR